MKLIIWTINIFLVLFLSSCQDKDRVVIDDNSSDYYITYKDYTLDSLSGNIIDTEITIDDFQSADECIDCHLQHFQEWETSFHAHAFSDKIFQNMWEHEKESRPISGINYCIQCHAPAAFVSGYDLDGIDISHQNNLPKAITEGISCDICHTMVGKSPSVHTQDHVAAVAQYHINPGEGVKYGSIQYPDTNSFHESAYLPLFNSSSSCLPCHNQSIRGMPIEMTFSEWDDHAGLSMAGPSCQSCHMPKQSDGHSSHYFAGVDILFYDGVDQSSSQYQEVEKLLHQSVDISFSRINPISGGVDSIIIDNDTLWVPITINNLAGHRFPSGTAFAREAWLELTITNSLNDTIYSKGIIDNSYQELNYNDSDLMFYTQILYDQDNHGGNIINSVSDALSYDDRTIPTLFYDSKIYGIALENQNDNNLSIKARMLFRAFKPHMVNEFLPESMNYIPVLEMDIDSTTTTIEQ